MDRNKQVELYKQALEINAKFELVFKGNWMNDGAYDLRDDMYCTLLELSQSPWDMELQNPPTFVMECWNDIQFNMDSISYNGK